MGKKVKRKTYVSKGQRVNCANLGNLIGPIDRALNKLKAWQQGKNPWITVSNRERNAPFIKVRANNYWGNPKFSRANLFGKAD